MFENLKVNKCAKCGKDPMQFDHDIKLFFYYRGNPYCLNCFFRLAKDNNIDIDLNIIKTIGESFAANLERYYNHVIFDKDFFNLKVYPN